jgi:leucyl-tRNA synthetase
LENGCRLINIPIECVHSEKIFAPESNDPRGFYLLNFQKYYLEYLQFVNDCSGYLFISEKGIYFNKTFYPNNLSDISFRILTEVEKMSKSKFNVVNPDVLIEKYGADTFRLYEMFLGPLEQSKPWDTNGIEGVFRFIRKCWRLYHDDQNNFRVCDEAPDAAELRVLHRTIKKIQEDIERLSFNTAVSTFMICVNELTELKCSKRSILSDLVVLIAPYAPHIAEELWSLLGNVTRATFPEFKPEYLIENTFEYPVSFNGKTRFKLLLPADLSISEIEKAVLEAKESDKWLQGKPPKKVIIVVKKIINIVLQG